MPILSMYITLLDECVIYYNPFHAQLLTTLAKHVLILQADALSSHLEGPLTQVTNT